MVKGKILAIIPARSGSKGVPLKNIRKISGLPLICHTIKNALQCKKIDRIVVSTESNQIAKISLNCGAEVPFLRPKSLAKDNSQVIDSIIYTINKLKQEDKYHPEYCLILQPTSPLRNHQDINKSIHQIKKYPQANAFVGVTPTKPYFFSINKSGYLTQKSNINLKKNTNRQSMTKAYQINGFIYLIKTNILLKEKTILPARTKAIIFDSWRSIDIDTEADFKISELIMNNIHHLK